MNTDNLFNAAINSDNAYVYIEPDTNSEVVCKLMKFSSVLVDISKTVNGFYKVESAIGAEGYCQQEFVTIAIT